MYSLNGLVKLTSLTHTWEEWVYSRLKLEIIELIATKNLINKLNCSNTCSSNNSCNLRFSVWQECIFWAMFSFCTISINGFSWMVELMDRTNDNLSIYLYIQWPPGNSKRFSKNEIELSLQIDPAYSNTPKFEAKFEFPGGHCMRKVAKIRNSFFFFFKMEKKGS